MDIDFHYHATFIAARFAGFSVPDAKIIATSAQMIDENGLGIAATGLNAVDKDTNEVVHIFKPLATFAAGAGENMPMGLKFHSQDRFASVWSVFHFLPGNFEVPSAVPPSFRSARWERRAWGKPKDEVPPLFRWLCRPHSPMAMHIIENCRALVNDEKGVVSTHGLAPYLIGITAHVFVDTWAHQDFTGPPEKRVNDVSGDTFYAFAPLSARKGTGLAPVIDEANLPWQKASWSIRNLEYAPRGSDVSYTGHGRMGTWPDHSALIFKYKPAWKGSEQVRNNPAHYFDAFLHLVAALWSIKHNSPYQPFELTERNISTLFLKTGGPEGVVLDATKMRHVNELLQKPREALPRSNAWHEWHIGKIDTSWDAAIAVHSKEWQAAMMGEFGVGARLPTWLPSRSQWIADFQQAVESSGKARQIEAHKLRALDYVKFNYAAKLHYRAVKFQLKALGEELIGEWDDGSAFVDDYEILSNTRRDPWREKIRRVLNACLKTTKKQYRQEGILVLLHELDLATSEAEIAAKLRLALTDAGEAVYTLRHRDKGNTVDKIKQLLQELNSAGPAPSVLAQFGLMPSVKEWKEKMSYVRMARRGDDKPLVAIDKAMEDFFTASDLGKIEKAQDIINGCDTWLAAPPKSKSLSRQQGVEMLRRNAIAWLGDRSNIVTRPRSTAVISRTD